MYIHTHIKYISIAPPPTKQNKNKNIIHTATTINNKTNHTTTNIHKHTTTMNKNNHTTNTTQHTTTIYIIAKKNNTKQTQLTYRYISITN